MRTILFTDSGGETAGIVLLAGDGTIVRHAHESANYEKAYLLDEGEGWRPLDKGRYFEADPVNSVIEALMAGSEPGAPTSLTSW